MENSEEKQSQSSLSQVWEQLSHLSKMTYTWDKLTLTHEADLNGRPQYNFNTRIVFKHTKSLMSNWPLPILICLFTEQACYS